MAKKELTNKKFYWTDKEQHISGTIGGEKYELTLSSYLVRSETDDPHLQFPSLYQDFVISIKQFQERVHDEDFEKPLRSDFRSKKILCPLWNQEGTPVSQDTLAKSRMFKSLLEATKRDDLADYRRKWINCFDNALELSFNMSKQPIRQSYDVLGRFFLSQNATYRLYLAPGKWLDGTAVSKDSLEEAYTHSMKSSHRTGVEPILLLNAPDEPETHHGELIKLSSNPLGLYTTWIALADLPALIKAQTSNRGTWLQKGPDSTTAKRFSENLFPRDEMTKFRKVNTESLIQYPGEKLVQYRRITPKTIMGNESANIWSKFSLNWDGEGNEVRAEWLHLTAHRFWPGVADRATNMIFGTKGCNTDMMRAEGAVTQLLQSGKVYAVEISPTIDYGLEEVTMLDADGYRLRDIPWITRNFAGPWMHWLAAELKYHINVSIPKEGGSWTLNHTRNIFHPLSRQRPFRFEYELDKILLGMNLDALPQPSPEQLTTVRERITQAYTEGAGQTHMLPSNNDPTKLNQSQTGNQPRSRGKLYWLVKGMQRAGKTN